MAQRRKSSRSLRISLASKVKTFERPTTKCGNTGGGQFLRPTPVERKAKKTKTEKEDVASARLYQTRCCSCRLSS